MARSLRSALCRLESWAKAIANLQRAVCVQMSKLRLVLLWTMFALQCSPLFGQVPSAVSPHVGRDFWGFKEGAPQGVIALAQTADGYLWIGSPTGLVRFDGVRFEPFLSPFGDQLLSTNIYALFAPPSGGLWIGYVFGGFSFLNRGRVTNYGGEIASSTGSVRGFAQDGDGILWAATNNGLWRFDHSNWQQIGAEWNAPLGFIGEVGFDQDGTLWALTTVLAAETKLLIYLPPGARKFHTAQKNVDVAGFTLDADRSVVTSLSSGPFAPDSSGHPDDRPPSFPVLRRHAAQIVDRTKSTWILQGRALIRSPRSELPHDALKTATPSNPETYNIAPDARLIDREGNIWFGDRKGTHRFFYSPLNNLEFPKNAKAGSDYYQVVADDHGAVWVCSGNFAHSSSLYREAVGKANLRSLRRGVGLAYRAPDKTFWFGGEDGLWHLVHGKFLRVDLPREMTDHAFYLQTITQDRFGGMWVSFGRHGLYRLANGVWTAYGGYQDLPKTGVVIEYTDSQGRVWFGYTKNTLAVLDGDHVQVFGPSDGLQVGNVTAIYGRGAKIWIGGEFGLQQFDHGRFHTIKAIDEEWLRGVSGIVETVNGDLWLNGLGGIFHIRRAELSEGLKNAAYLVKGERFGRREGLPGLAFQVRPLNTAIEGTDGRLWFAEHNGVVWLDPTQAENKVPPPPISIQSLSADDKFYDMGSPLKFPAHTSSVQISYAAVSLSDPEAIRFRYRLQESDKDWHEVSAPDPVSYRNLSPGSYHFSVNASDTNGVWSDKVATAQFTILPAFYQTRWFIALCVATALALLYVLYMLRVQQLVWQFDARLEERVGERTRIARELHDTLLQSFQAVLLKLHALTYQLLDRPEVQKTLESVIEQASQAVTEGRDAVQGLRSSTVVTNDLARAIRILGAELAADQGDSNSPDFRVQVEGTSRDLAPIVRDDIYRIAGEAVRNAFQHAQAGRIEVEIWYDQRQLRLRIRDDGKGIDPKVLEAGARAGHYGLSGLHERAKLVGGKLAVSSQPGFGTEIELTIPASVVYASARARRVIVSGAS